MLKELFQNVSEPFKTDTLFIVKTYMDAGYECYVVGGPIRDLINGLSPKDIDLSTNCPLEVTNKLFEKVIPTGEHHGTLTIHINGENYEVTRYRFDTETDGRHAKITFADNFNEDSSRRDFTMNSIGYNPITDEVRDPNNGLEDINHGIIRFVGNAEDRIKEDFLRAIRFCRFMIKFHKFGFTTDRETLETTINTYDNLVVSVERIYQEIDAMFVILKEDASTLNFVHNTLHDMKIFDRFISDRDEHDKVIGLIFKTFDYFPLVLQMDGDIQSLKLGSEYKVLYNLFKTFEKTDFLISTTTKDMLEATNGDFVVAERVLNLFNSFNSDNNHSIGLISLKHLENKVGTIEEEAFMLSQLNIGGEELISMGFKGINIGIVLKKLLVMVKKDYKLNNLEILVNLAKPYN